MKLDDIVKESKELGNDVVDRFKDSTVNYRPKSSQYKNNTKKALIGLGVGLVGGVVHPMVSAGGFLYSGIKGYQAYRDYKLRR